MKPLKLSKLTLEENFDLGSLVKSDPRVIRVKGWNAYINNVCVGQITKWERKNQTPEYQIRLNKFFCESDPVEFIKDPDGKRRWKGHRFDMKDYNGHRSLQDAGMAMKRLIIKNILLVMAS